MRAFHQEFTRDSFCPILWMQKLCVLLYSIHIEYNSSAMSTQFGQCESIMCTIERNPTNPSINWSNFRFSTQATQLGVEYNVRDQVKTGSITGHQGPWKLLHLQELMVVIAWHQTHTRNQTICKWKWSAGYWWCRKRMCARRFIIVELLRGLRGLLHWFGEYN